MRMQFLNRSILVGLVVLALIIGICPNGFAKNIMVIAPHEDDEAIACAGVIRNAVMRGDSVKLVLVTNGDYIDGYTKARARLLQSIQAMEMLGLDKEDILYFGYADNSVLAHAYQAPDPDRIFFSTDGTTNQTYGFPDLMVDDYHHAVFGVHALYNRDNILTDVYEVLDSYRPDQIYMPSPMERHVDHSATALFVYEALLNLKTVSSYSPVIYEYMIYKSGLPQSTLDPTVPVSNTEADMNKTPYSWDSRVTVPVPAAMTLAFSSGNNLKYNVLRAYGSNTGSYFDRFIRDDEVFWKRETNNLAFSATVTASTQNASTGQYGRKVADGVIMGYPFENDLFPLYRHEWATTGQLNGAWVQLSWPSSKRVSLIKLYDRPNSVDHISGGTLTFSDGSSVQVGSLPDNGSALTVSFAPKYVSWVRFTVNQAQGANIGLSEFEVFSYTTVENIAPFSRITVSSENVATTQLGIKAVDGSTNGYPNDYTREWATMGQLQNAWIKLDFRREYTLNQIYLYDRPNLVDHISYGYLSFSDGSTLIVNSLPNNGAAFPLSFPEKTVTWVKFTVLGAEGANIGLSEFRVYLAP